MGRRGWLAVLVVVAVVVNGWLLREEPSAPVPPRRPAGLASASAAPAAPAPRVASEPVNATTRERLPSAATNDVAAQWAQARQRFTRADRLSTEVQAVLDAPTAAGLFHAWNALRDCDGLGPRYRAAAGPHAHFARLLERCREAPRSAAFEQQARRLPLSEDDRDLFDAMEGKGRYRETSFTERLARAGTTHDAAAIAEMVAAWSTAEHASLDGRGLDQDDTALFHLAAALVACRAADACESSTVALGLCAEQHVCTGSHWDNMARLVGPDTFAQVHRHVARIEEAVRSGDYGGFR